ncbi:hypothetical protein C0992_007716 [Termitomyces sp. T32_za158]|nr:hypothetical protein C0992_007716 [Termitomyces sp. T32_za158]
MPQKAACGKENVSPAKGSKAPKQAKKTDKKPPTRAKWSSADDATLIEVLKEQQARGNQADNNWKAVVWTEAEKALARSEERSQSAPKKAKGCNDHWILLRSQAQMLQKMRNELSGWGWDGVRGMLIANDETWDTYLEAHPEATIFRTKPFPLYDDILSLIEGRYATGEGAMTIPELYDSSSEGGDVEAFQHDHQDSPFPTQAETIKSDDSGNDEEHHEDHNLTQESDMFTIQSSLQPFAQTPLKRNSSLSNTSSISAKRVRLTGPVAVNNVADALFRVASAFSQSDEPSTPVSNLLQTPIRRRNAIKLISKDINLTTSQQAKAIRLFRHDIAIADSYMDIDNEELRTEYILGEMEDSGN